MKIGAIVTFLTTTPSLRTKLTEVAASSGVKIGARNTINNFVSVHAVWAPVVCVLLADGWVVEMLF